MALECWEERKIGGDEARCLEDEGQDFCRQVDGRQFGIRLSEDEDGSLGLLVRVSVRVPLLSETAVSTLLFLSSEGEAIAPEAREDFDSLCSRCHDMTLFVTRRKRFGEMPIAVWVSA